MSDTEATPRATRPKSAFRRLSFACLVVVVALALFVELVPRVVAVPKLTPAELDPLKEALKDSRVQPHPYLAYTSRPNFVHEPTEKDPASVHHNSLGFNGPETTWEKPAGVYRIVCLGGSSTYGIGPSSTETNWPVVLQAELNARSLPKPVEVLNLGVQGYSTFESEINLNLRGVDLRPDLVLVYHTINDLRCALYPGVARDNTHWRAIWPVDRPSEIEALFERSNLYLAWRRYFTDWWETRGALGAYVIVDFGKYAPDDYAQPTDLNLGFDSFRRNVVSIVAIARAHGADAMLVTQAVRMGDFERFGSSDAQKAGFDRMTRILGEIANERSVPYCDARAVLEPEADRQRAATGADRIFVRPDKKNGEVHLTDEGCVLLAKTLAQRIVELGLVR